MKNALSTAQYKGVRGWLLFLCVSMTILFPLQVLAVRGSQGEDIWHPTLPMLFDLTIAAWSIYVGICLWRVRPRAVQKARVFLWSLTALNVWLAVLMFFSPDTNPDMVFMSCMGGVLYATARLAYLETSKRVKATYAETEPCMEKLRRDVEQAMEEADNAPPYIQPEPGTEARYFQDVDDCLRAMGDRGDLAFHTQLHPDFMKAKAEVYRAGFECYVPEVRVASVIADAAYLYPKDPSLTILVLERTTQQWAFTSAV
jgi:hypothetical protein